MTRTHSEPMRSILAVPLLTMLMVLFAAVPAWADLRVRDICRVKGQEENVLQGMGLVVGLRGTGDGDAPTQRMLAQMMSHMLGAVVSTNVRGQTNLEELKNARNVAIVVVTASVPGEGAREGSRLNCSVQALSAKSLEGGYLMLTPLLGPRPGVSKIYGFAQGPLKLDGGNVTTASVHLGTRMETDVTNAFVHQGRVTLVLDRNHANFQTAQDIEELLNNEKDFIDQPGSNGIAKARDQVNIEVQIPEKYRENPVQFASIVMNLRLSPPQTEARVVIRERDGVIVIGDNVEIGPVAVTHRNLSIQTGGQNPINQFVPVDTVSDTSVTKLQSLVNALNAVKVPTSDIIDIIKGLERSGDLYGRVIIE